MPSTTQPADAGFLLPAIQRPASKTLNAVKAKWTQAPKAYSSPEGNVINLLEEIGYDWWSERGTAQIVIDQLSRMTGDVVVNINSPGGDVFEGVAIHNALRMYDRGQITIRIIGIAASIASVIAMAGDRIEIGETAFLMIHNSTCLAAGDHDDLASAADALAQIDGVMADLYAQRTGLERAAVVAMMDAEKFIGGAAAVVQGFADALLTLEPAKPVAVPTPAATARYPLLPAASALHAQASVSNHQSGDTQMTDKTAQQSGQSSQPAADPRDARIAALEQQLAEKDEAQRQAEIDALAAETGAELSDAEKADLAALTPAAFATTAKLMRQHAKPKASGLPEMLTRPFNPGGQDPKDGGRFAAWKAKEGVK